MKTKFVPSSEKGSALLVTMVLMTILAMSIAGYLTYAEQQARLGMRAQAWNMALSVSEAGVEEGLQQLNNNYDNLTADGWTQEGTTYSTTRTLPNGDSYKVSINYANLFAPEIISRAYINSLSLASATPGALLATIGVDGESSPNKVTRAVRVTTSRGSLYLAAMVAKHKIDMNGNNIATDSFDSGDPAKSTNGRYDPAKYTGDMGDVASNDGVQNAVSVGNANIYGRVATGPGGSVSIGSQGGVGTHEWQAANGNTPQPGYVLNNANFTFPDTSLPYTSGEYPGPGDIITVSSVSTNITSHVNEPNPPGAPGPNETIGPVSTNTTYISTTVYPGAKSGLTTNITFVTTNAYPGAVAGLITNCIGFTVVTNSNPGAQMCATASAIGTMTVTASYPGNMPGLTTNYVAVITGTNCGSYRKTSNRPPEGTYCPSYPPHQSGNGGGNNSNWEWYTIGSYNYTTNIQYSYPNMSYSYATEFSFTYPIYSYTYPNLTYSWVVYTGEVTYTTNHYDHVLSSGDYYAGDLTGKTIVTGNARLVLPSGLKMSGGDELTIDYAGSLQVYSGGDSIVLNGNAIMNRGGVAANLIVWGTSTVKTADFTLNGNAEFTGVLVAPNAVVKMNGGGSADYDFTGALLVNSVKMNGHFKFHYDEALGRMPGQGRFLITKWDEIP